MKVRSERGREALYIGCVYMPTDSTSSTSTSAMNRLGYKHHCLCVLVALGCVEQLSWHHLPIWLLLLAAPL